MVRIMVNRVAATANLAPPQTILGTPGGIRSSARSGSSEQFCAVRRVWWRWAGREIAEGIGTAGGVMVHAITGKRRGAWLDRTLSPPHCYELVRQLGHDANVLFSCGADAHVARLGVPVEALEQ
jgi:hypothetical protein